MEVNTDITEALKGGYTCCVPRYYSTQRDKALSFHKFPRGVSLREKWVNSIKRKDFIPGEQHRVCSQHFHGAKKQGMSDVPVIFPFLPQSKQRKPPKIRLPLEPPAKRKKIGTGKSKALADAVGEEVDFLCGLVDSNEKERTDMKLENACMKREIADMKQEIADMKQEIADLKEEIADMKQEIADMKQEIADMKQEIADMKQEIADMKLEKAGMKLR